MANLSNINGKFVVEQTTGFVGVGTTDPSYPIEVLNASAEIALNASGGSIYRVQSDSASNFIIRKEGVGDRLVISSGGSATFANRVNAGESFGALKNGADTVADGPFFRLTNAAQTRQQLFQLDASNNIDYWYYNGSTWTQTISLLNNGGATFAGDVTLSGIQKKIIFNTPFRYIQDARSGADYLTIAQNSFAAGIQLGFDNTVGGGFGPTMTIIPSGVTNNAGSVGIGTTSPVQKFHLQATGTSYVHIGNDTTGAAAGDGADIGFFTSQTSLQIVNRENDAMVLSTNGTERMRISSDGKVTIGNTASVQPLTVAGNVLFRTTTVDGFENRFQFLPGGAGDPGNFYIYNAVETATVRINAGGDSYFNGGNVGIGNSPASDAKLEVWNGNLRVRGDQNNYIQLSNVAGNTKASLGNAGNEGDLSLYTSGNVKTVYLSSYYNSYINSSGGNLGIGTTAINGSFGASNTILAVKGKTSGGEGIIQITGLGNNATDNVGALTFHSQAEADPMCSIRSIRGTGDDVGSMAFLTNNGGTEAQRMSILYTGEIVLAAAETTAISTDPINSLGTVNRSGLASGAYARLVMQERAGNWISFTTSSAHYGTISRSGSGVNYGSNSDYRLKENVLDLTNCIDKVKLLSPKTFNFIDRPNITVNGFLAHEVQEVVSEAVSGEKDGVITTGNVINDSDGVVLEQNVIEPEELKKGTSYIVIKTEPEYQQIDQAKLVPLLVGAIQELEARLKILENK